MHACSYTRTRACSLGRPASTSPACVPLAAVPDIRGTLRQLGREFRGKVLIIVNVASKCGFTGAWREGPGAVCAPARIGEGGTSFAWLAAGLQRAGMRACA